MATFELHGWSGSTINAIAGRARVSRQTVEALFGTKTALLRAAVDLAIRGDTLPTPMPRRDVVAEMELAGSATQMLDLHARHIRAINGRSARMAWVVEHAAASAPPVSELWATMTTNRRYAVTWAAATLLEKPGAPNLDPQEVEEAFWIGIDWRTYRSLTEERGLGGDAFEGWLRRYYRAMFGPRATQARSAAIRPTGSQRPLQPQVTARAAARTRGRPRC
jgi:AcrR family transcriptional regulator